MTGIGCRAKPFATRGGISFRLTDPAQEKGTMLGDFSI
jgi:hypothetical protein